jgi:predicted GNAT family acetyltransferase
LGEADAPEMMALARQTEPGPFYAETYRMGSFIGVRREGRLVAMAGERLRLPGFTEVSGVCTHPDHRGQGLARTLMLHVMAGIRARGDVPFLHAYADNAGAIALYRKLGFVLRREVVLTVLVRPTDLPIGLPPGHA